MLIVELEEKTLALLRKKTSLRGQIKQMEEKTGVHRTTIGRVKALGTASEDVAKKLEAYLHAPTPKSKKKALAA